MPATSTNPWIAHIQKIYRANPGMSWCTAMTEAAKTYKRKATVPAPRTAAKKGAKRPVKKAAKRPAKKATKRPAKKRKT